MDTPKKEASIMASSEASEIARVMADLAADRGVSFAPGSLISAQLVRTLLNAVPRGPDGRPHIRDAQFSGVTITGDVSFKSCRFLGPADFSRCNIEGSADFGDVIFERSANFYGATFDRSTHFEEVEFCGDADLSQVTYKSLASYDRARWRADASFCRSIFESDADLRLEGIDGNACFHECIWTRARQLGPISVLHEASFRGAVFRSRVDVFVRARTVDLSSSSFDSGGVIRITAADVRLSAATFGAPTTLSGITPDDNAENGSGQTFSQSIPRIDSLDRANAANLTLDHMDLKATLLAGALGLDKIRLDSSVRFAHAPPYRARRRVIADEILWRSSRRYSWGWHWHPLSSLRPTQEALDVAAAYRALRKSLEDAKNEPGAADFYYGEMEMRLNARLDSRRRRSFDRFTIGAYWLTAGYGTRAWRSLALLIVIILTSALVMSHSGFDRTPTPLTQIERITRSGIVEYRAGPPPSTSYADGVRFSVEAATSLLRQPSPARLTNIGRTMEVALRLIGPALLALTVLSLRSRIKR